MTTIGYLSASQIQFVKDFDHYITTIRLLFIVKSFGDNNSIRYLSFFKCLARISVTYFGITS